MDIHVGEERIRLRVATVGLKADWPALDKLGRLSRHFRREAYPSGSGICHYCMANTSVCETWHQHRFDEAPWVATMGTATEPWLPGQESGFTRFIPIERHLKASFYLPDPFHTILKGVHADLSGSGIVPCMYWHLLGICYINII